MTLQRQTQLTNSPPMAAWYTQPNTAFLFPLTLGIPFLVDLDSTEAPDALTKTPRSYEIELLTALSIGAKGFSRLLAPVRLPQALATFVPARVGRYGMATHHRASQTIQIAPLSSPIESSSDRFLHSLSGYSILFSIFSIFHYLF
jgi:hypothetical protein